MEALKRGAIGLAVIVLLASPALGAPPSGEVAAGEYQIKAAFLQHFAQFVEWPANALPPNAPLVIGLVGDDPFGRAIDDVIGGKRANGHLILLRRLRWNDSFSGCHIVYISSAELQHLGAVLEAVRATSTLTVADIDRFVERGGMIEMVMAQNRVRFDINPGAAAEAHLKISSKLLQVAREIRETEGGR
jgi:hypothetical protein